jgi:hypothetical protein
LKDEGDDRLTLNKGQHKLRGLKMVETRSGLLPIADLLLLVLKLPVLPPDNYLIYTSL